MSIVLLQLNQLAEHYGPGPDFITLYTAARIIREGKANRFYDLALQRQIQHEAVPGAPFITSSLHPPFEALFFVPFATLSYRHAFVLWGALNLLGFGLIIYLLRLTGVKLQGWRGLLWLCICLFFVIVVLALGQDTLFLVPIFLLAFLALKRNRDYAAGAVLGLGLFRFEILLPFVFIFFLRRYWKLVAGFVAVGIAELLVSAAVVGLSGLAQYVHVLLAVGGSASGTYVDRSTAWQMPSLYGALHSIFRGMVPVRWQFPVVLAATLLLVGWAALRFKGVCGRNSASFDLGFSLAVVAALLASYHLFISEATPLILAGYLILAYESSQPRQGILGGRQGSALLLLFLATIAGLMVAHSRAFSLVAIVLLGMMAWLSEVSSAPREHVTGV